MNSYPGMPIIPRQLNLKFDDLKRNWAFDNPLFTAYIAALSSVFPEGEKFFIRSVRHYADQVTDPKLQQDVKDFIRQEAYHGMEHIVFNNKCKELGWSVDKVESWIFKVISFIESKFSPERRLANTVCLEHMTASFAQFMMTHPELIKDQHPDLGTLLIWHSIEETEHKAVAFDVYQSCINDPKLLNRVMRFIHRSFTIHMLLLAIFLLIKSRQIPSWANIKQFWSVIGGSKGLFAQINKDVKEFYRDDFHPWQHDNSKLAESWIQTLNLATQTDT